MMSSLSNYIPFIFLFLGIESVFGQCKKFDWIDANLQEHSGPMSLDYFPDLRFVNYNELYKFKKVSRVTEFDNEREWNDQKYDDQGYLTFRWEWGNSGTQDFHRYYYFNGHKSIVDSIKHVIYKSEFDPVTNKNILPSRTDTIYRVQKFFYDKNNFLIATYNTVKIKDNDWTAFNRLNLYCPDSLFYYYDECENLDSLLSYSGAEMKLRISYSCLGQDCQVYLQPQWQEDWWFNSDWKFQGLLRYGHSIRFKYRKNKIVHCKESIPLFYNGAQKEWVRDISYKYWRDKLIKISEHSITESGKTYRRVIKVKRYKNGLLKIKPDGHSVKYLYSDK